MGMTNRQQSRSHVKFLMEKREMTVRKLASMARIDITTIMRARDNEKITSCTIDTLIRIARALDVDVKDLFDIGNPHDL